MLHTLATFAASVAAAVTGTATPETHAAGCRFGPEPTQPATRARRPILYRWALRDVNGVETARGSVESSDIRGALRAWNREARSRHGHGRPFLCSFEGPAFRCVGIGQQGNRGRFVAECLTREGVAVGLVDFQRADGAPIRIPDPHAVNLRHRKGVGR